MAKTHLSFREGKVSTCSLVLPSQTRTPQMDVLHLFVPPFPHLVITYQLQAIGAVDLGPVFVHLAFLAIHLGIKVLQNLAHGQDVLRRQTITRRGHEC